MDSPRSLDEDQMVDVKRRSTRDMTKSERFIVNQMDVTNDNDSQTNVQSELLIKDEEKHPMLVSKFLYKLTFSSTKKTHS